MSPHIVIDEEYHQRVKIEVAKQKITIKEFIEVLIIDYFRIQNLEKTQDKIIKLDKFIE